MIKGNGASFGIAIAKALVKTDEELKIEKYTIDDTVNEQQRFDSCVNQSKKELQQIAEQARIEMGADKAEIFEAHLLVLSDPELIDRTKTSIKDLSLNAEYVFNEIVKEHITLFESIEDEYMKERASDIRDVSERVIRHLLEKEVVNLAALEDDIIVVAHDLTPSDTATMNKNKVKGILTNIGGKTSHTAIMARTLEIPAVLGLKTITDQVKDGDLIVLDGEKGHVIINPSDEELARYKNLKEEYEIIKKELNQYKGLESKTKDDHPVELVGNIGTPNDLAALENNDAEGVGLYRTEFLYMDRDSLPTEDEQFDAYKTVLEKMGDKPVVIRTLDIGGDKKLPYLDIDEEMNPFLGYRAIRICLNEPPIFKTQLRALLRASVHGNLKIMFPMISNLTELLEAKSVLSEVETELKNEGIELAKYEVGMMIEVPSAAIYSDVLAKHVDFFSIGTNDLIQYTCAVDRMNEKLQNLYNPFNPSVLRLIKTVIDNGHKENIWVGMCGEVAGDERLIPVLLGMGLDEFSMSPISILRARKLISNLTLEEANIFMSDIMQTIDEHEIEEKCTAFLETKK